jgi:hypothetical protein
LMKMKPSPMKIGEGFFVSEPENMMHEWTVLLSAM